MKYQCNYMMLHGCTNDNIFVRVFAEDVFDYGVGICIIDLQVIHYDCC